MKRLALIAAAAILLAAATGPSASLSPSQFRDRYSAAVKSVTRQEVTAIDERTFSTKTADGTDLTIAIDNAYAQYIADPSQLDAIIARYVQTLTSAPVAGDEPVDRLIVIVRPSNYLTNSLQPGASFKHFAPSRPMAGDLSYFLAVDSDTSIRSASIEDLTRWHLDEAGAWEHAVNNIKDRMGAVGIGRFGSEDGASGIGSDSGLAPSLLATPMMCGPNAPSGMNIQIVLVYAKDFFLFAAPADGEGMARFWKAVRAETSAGRSMSNTPLTCVGGRWTAVPIQ